MSEKVKKVLSILLTFCMIMSSFPVTILAEEQTAGGLCEHHQAHTSDCGYAEAVEGASCTHTCGEGCYTLTTACVHNHDDGTCSYQPAKEPTSCGHVHDETCGYAAAIAEVLCGCVPGEDGILVHADGCGYVAPIAEQSCNHIHDEGCGYSEGTAEVPCDHKCSTESGCVTSVLNCQHLEHTADCGYVAAAEGAVCTYHCEICSGDHNGEETEEFTESSTEGTEETTEPTTESTTEAETEPAAESAPVCTCGTDDDTVHATDCPAYVAPENPVCYCAEKCTEDNVNVWCDVCGFDYTMCGGEDTAAVYDAPEYNSAEKTIISNGIDLTLEAGETEGYTKVRYGSTYMDFSDSGLKIGATVYEAKLSNVTIRGQGAAVTMDGGDVNIIRGVAYVDDSTGNPKIVINGGNVDQIYGVPSRTNFTGNVQIVINGGSVRAVLGGPSSGTMTGNVSIAVNGGSVECIKGGAETLNGDLTITVTGGTVTTIYPADHGNITGKYNLRVTGGEVENVYALPQGNSDGVKMYAAVTGGSVGTIYCPDYVADYVSPVLYLAVPVTLASKYNNSSKYQTNLEKFIDVIDQLLYVKSDNTWELRKGTIDGATQGEDFVIKEGQSLTVTSDMTCETDIVNYGTIVVKDGGVLNHVTNYGTMTIESGSTVTRIENRGTLNMNSGANLTTLDNYGTTDYAGSSKMTLNNYGHFYCNGSHDNMTINQADLSNNYHWFRCYSEDCTKEITKGRFYCVMPLTWNAYYLTVTNEQGLVHQDRSYSCTLVPNEGCLLPKTITVYNMANFTETLVQGTHYSYDYTTGEFKLFAGVVTWYEIRITAIGEWPIGLYRNDSNYYTTVTLNQDSFLWDGTAKEPKITSITTYIYDHPYYPVEGEDYTVTYENNVDAGTGYVVITGQGYYTGTKRVPFTIYQLDLTENHYKMEIEEGDWSFINGEIKPKVTSVYKSVYDAETDTTETTYLTEGVDYTVSYENNINPGTGTVTVTGMGKFCGTLTEEFTISKARFTRSNITISGVVDGKLEVPYSGGPQSLDIQVSFNGMELTEGVDYVVYDGTATGNRTVEHVGDTAEIRLQGKGDYFYNDNLYFNWTVVNADINDFTFVGIYKHDYELIYNGFPQTVPSNWYWYVVVQNADGDENYIAGDWSPVTNVSDICTFTADDDTYFSGTIEVSGVISPRDMYDITAYCGSLTYTGQEQEPTLTAYIYSSGNGSYVLTEGVDFTVSGTTKATEPGTYTMTLTSISENLTGTKTVTWTIKPVTISADNVTMDAAPSFTYNINGIAQTPETKVYYTYPNGTTVEVPGTWTSATNVGDDVTFTVAGDCAYFTGSFKVEDVVEPLDITTLDLELTKSGEYTGYVHDLTYDLGNITCRQTWSEEPLNIGTYTLKVEAYGNYTGSLTHTYTITKAALSVIVRLNSKTYDGTTDVEIKQVHLKGAADGADVTLNYEDLVVTLPSADAGDYYTAAASGLTLTGEDVENYDYDLTTVSLIGLYGYIESADAYFTIYKHAIHITAEEQDLLEGEELDQSKWYVDEASPLPEGFTLSGVVLTANEDGEIIPSGGVVTMTATDEDVTKNFHLYYYSSDLNLICTNHVCDSDGFCSNCGGYESAVLNDNGTPDDEWDDCYEIYNAGQLYWFANYINKESNEADAILMNNIVVPATAPEWTPIINFYGTFNGNYKTVSGLTVSSGTNVGMFGGGGYAYGTIQNLHLTNSTFTGTGYVGGIAGSHAGTIENCYATNITLSGGTNMGAIVGYMESGMVTNCYADTTLAGYVYPGYAYATNCYYLSDTETDTIDGTTAKTAEQFASGEVAYLLNGSTSDGIWKQTLKTNAFPGFTGSAVYYGYTSCEDTEMIYTNDSTASEEEPPHSGEFTYEDNEDGTTHKKMHKCCGDVAEEAETHTPAYKVNEAGDTVIAYCSDCNAELGTVTISATGKTYDGTAAEAAVSGEGALADTSGIAITYAEKGGASLGENELPTNAGTYTAAFTMGDTTASVEFTIDPKKITPFISGTVTKVYDGTNTVPENHGLSIILSDLVGSDAVEATATYTYDGVNAGTTSITAANIALTGDDSGNYTLTSATVSANVGEITKAPVTITEVGGDFTYNGETYDVSQLFLIDENAGTVTYTVVQTDEGYGTLDGSLLTITRTGLIHIKVTTAETTNYAAGEADAFLTVNKGTGSASVSMEGWNYGETAKAPVPVSTTNGTDNVTYLYEGDGYSSSEVPTNAGTYTVTAAFAATGLYEKTTATAEFTIAKAKAEINVDTMTINVTYGETVTLPTATSNFGTVDCDKNANDLVNADTYTVTYTVESTYNYDGDTKTVTVIIGQKAVAEPTVTGTYTYTGNEQSVVLDGVESYMTIDSGNKGTDAKSYEVVITLDGNHKWADGSDGKIQWSIGKAAGSVTAPAAQADLVYTGSAMELIEAGSSTTGTIQYKLNDGEYGTDIPTATNAGTYTIYYKVVGDDNHEDVAEQSFTVTIGKRSVTITANDQTITYGDAISNTEFSCEGLAEGHSVTVDLTPSTVNVTADGKTTASEAIVTAGVEDVTSNYEISYGDPAKLVIEPDTSKITDLTVGNVTSANEEDIQAVQEMMENAESVKEEWEAITETCEELQEKIEAVAAENDRIQEEVSKVDLTSVKSSDEEAITKLISDIDNLLGTTNLTDEERNELEGIKTKCENLIAKINGTEALISQLDKAVDDLDTETVKSTDKADLEQLVKEIEGLLDTKNLTEEEQKALTDTRSDANALLEVIETAQKAADTENTEKVENVTSENVKPEDKGSLEDAKADLENALEKNSGNYTEAEKQMIQDKLDQVNTALEVIKNVENVNELVNLLPDKPNADKKEEVEAINAAKEAYDALTDYEKSLVDESLKKKLDELVIALEEAEESETQTETEAITETNETDETEAITETNKTDETEAITETNKTDETEAGTETNKTNETEKTEGAAATGDQTPTGMWMLTMLGSLLVLLLFGKKRYGSLDR